eukprot:181746_1
MRQRGSIASSLFARPKLKTDGVIGFAPGRRIEHFTFMDAKHSLIVLAIIVSTISLTASIHWLCNDYDEIEKQQNKELKSIENLFHDEKDWLQKTHDKTVETLQQTHQNDVDEEMKWFLQEMKSITDKKIELEKKHKDAQNQLESSAKLHESHSSEQKELDDQLNQLYTSSGDKIQHLNKRLNACTDTAKDLEIKIASAKRLQSNDDEHERHTIAKPTDDHIQGHKTSEYEYKYRDDHDILQKLHAHKTKYN